MVLVSAPVMVLVLSKFCLMSANDEASMSMSMSSSMVSASSVTSSTAQDRRSKNPPALRGYVLMRVIRYAAARKNTAFGDHAAAAAGN